MVEQIKSDDEKPVDPLAPVIDLEAEDVVDQQQSKTPEPPFSPASKRKTAWRYWPYAFSILIALFLGAWAYKNYGQGVWPSDAVTSLETRIATLEATEKTLKAQLSGVGTALDKLNTESAGFGQTTSELQKTAESALNVATAAKDESGSFKVQLSTVEQRVAALQTSLDSIKSIPQASESVVTSASVDSAALALLSARVDSLEKDLAALKQRDTTAPGTETTTLLSQLLADLNAKLATGAPYQSELERIAQLVPAAPGLEQLQSSASSGVTTASALAEEARKLSASLPAPISDETPTNGEGYWDSVSSMLSSIVKIRRIDQIDWRDIAEEASILANEGDLKQAVKRIEEGEGDIPAQLSQWRDKAKARIAAEAAFAEVQAAVLREISALGGAQ